MSWKTWLILIVCLLAVVIALVFLIKAIIRIIKKKIERGISRGDILICSVLIETLIFATCCVLPWFFITHVGWKVLLIIVGAMAMIVSGFCLIYFWWAPNNLFFTFVKEGTAKIVVKGHKFHKAIIQFKDHGLDNPETTVNILQLPEGEEEKKHLFGGLKYYGLWPIDDIFVYEFQWVGMATNGELELHPPEHLDYIFIKDDVYGCEVVKAEDKELMPLNIKLTFTVRIVNPYKALFVIENWYETMINRITPYIRDFITTDTYAKFITDPQRIGVGVKAKLEEENILKELKDRYGVEIRRIEVNAINPQKEFREATMKKVLALRERDKTLTNARAEKDRLKIIALGEKERISIVYTAVKEFGLLGEKIRGFEALEKSPGEGSKWVIPADLASLLPGSPPKNTKE